MMLRILVGCYGVLRIVLRKKSVTKTVLFLPNLQRHVQFSERGTDQVLLQ